LGIACAYLEKKELGVDLPPEIGRSHWRRRLGQAILPIEDKWWTVTSLREAEDAATEIVNLLSKCALSEFAQFPTACDLYRYGKNGGGCGITEYQRKRIISVMADECEQNSKNLND
jgi:hypothetical protein